MSKVKTNTLKKKAKDSVSETFEKSSSFVKDNPFLILKGLLFLGVVYLGYKAVKGITEKEDPNAGGGDVNPNNPNIVVSQGTITKGEAISKAASLMELMKGIGGIWSSDFQAMKDIFSNINTYDFWSISKEFGRPYRSPFTGESSNKFLSVGNDMSLIQWLNAELTTEEYTELKEHLPPGTI